MRRWLGRPSRGCHWGPSSIHAPHLPLGTDSLTARHLVTRAAEDTGGVVLPPSTLTLGTLHLPWSFRYEAALVEATLRSTIEQLGRHSAHRCVVDPHGTRTAGPAASHQAGVSDAESQVRSADPWPTASAATASATWNSMRRWVQAWAPTGPSRSITARSRRPRGCWPSIRHWSTLTPCRRSPPDPSSASTGRTLGAEPRPSSAAPRQARP